MRKYSVIIPVRNWAESITEDGIRLILSALYHPSNQLYIDELLLVDDYSSREQLEIQNNVLSSFSINYRNCQIIGGNPEGGNRGVARNTGAYLARNDYLFIMDQDSILTENFFIALDQYITNIGEEHIFRGQRIDSWALDTFHKPLRPQQCFIPQNFDIHRCEYKKDEWCKESFYSQHNNHHTRMWELIKNNDPCLHKTANFHLNPVEFISYGFYVRKDIFNRVGCFDPRFWGWGEEDVEFGWRAFKKGIYTLSCDRNLIIYHYPHSVSDKKLDEWIVNNIVTIDKHPDMMQYRLHGFPGVLSGPCKMSNSDVQKRIAEKHKMFIEQQGITIQQVMNVPQKEHNE